MSVLFTLPAHSIDTLYTLDSDSNSGSKTNTASGKSANPVENIHFAVTTLSNLQVGKLIDVPIPGGRIVKGIVIESKADSKSFNTAAGLSASNLTVVSLDNGAGSVELTSVNNTITEMVLHDVVDEKIYAAQINSNGDGELKLKDNNDYYCVRYPEPNALAPIVQQTPQIAALTPDITALRNLQSRPGSANVLYIDYWGGTLTDSAWNANYTSNQPINYTAYSRDSDPLSFTSDERYNMWLAWREAVEDFAPFNINITTMRSVYDAAAVTNRTQMIVTTSTSWYPNNAGGVAYVNIFNNNTEYYKVGWTWNLGPSSMGMTISHEAGHQLGLFHDGEGGLGYYSGHGAWGPIMGAPFGKPYVQWSKGEYPNANQFEDDIAKVSTKLGLIADEAGNSYSSATNLSLPVNSVKGTTGFGDTDTYKFSLSASGSVQINVIPLLGDENEVRAANLAMDVSLVKLNASGGVIANISMINSSDNSPLSPLTNTFNYNATLASGIYAIKITPQPADTNWATGFGNYGNAGEYRLTVNATIQNAPDLIVQSASVNDNSLTPNQGFTISATVKNQGNANSNSTTLRYYRSTDSNISASIDSELATDAVSALAANGNSPESVSVNAPNTTGTYWIGACVDSVTNESNTQNNCSTGVQITVSPAPTPDLIVNPINVSETSLTPGQSFSISATVRNQGNGSSANTTLRYYRSTDSNISASIDSELATDAVSALAANGSSAENTSANAPNATGTYWIGACVDGITNESNTQNNCSSGVQITVSPAPTPDLIVSPISVDDNSLIPNQSFTISATVKNQGNANSSSTTLRYYRSTDSNISASIDSELATDPVSVLAANGNSAEITLVNAPASPDTYWIGACVDSVTNESNTQNNCSTGVQITVSPAPAPDLVVSSISVNVDLLTPGQDFTISATVKNQGNGSSASTTLRYYRSTDSNINPNIDSELDTDAVLVLAANSNSAKNALVNAPTSLGTYWIGACVDSISGESDTQNNCSGGVPIIVSATPQSTEYDCTLFVFKTITDKTVVICL